MSQTIRPHQREFPQRISADEALGVQGSNPDLPRLAQNFIFHNFS